MTIPCSIHKFFAEGLRQLLERFSYVYTVILRQSIDHLTIEPTEFHRAKHQSQSSARYAQLLIDKLCRVKFLGISYAAACRACAERCIEGKHSRLKFLYAYSVIRAGQFAAEGLFIMMIIKIPFYIDQSISVAHGQFAGFCDSAFLSLLHHDSVHNYFYVMFESFFKLYFFFVYQSYFTVYFNTAEALFSDSFQNFFMFPLASPYHGSKYNKFCSFRKIHYGIHHLIH